MSAVPLHPVPEDLIRVSRPEAGLPSGGVLVPDEQRYLTRKHIPLGPYMYSRPMPRVLGGFQGGGCFLMNEVPL